MGVPGLKFVERQLCIIGTMLPEDPKLIHYCQGANENIEFIRDFQPN